MDAQTEDHDGDWIKKIADDCTVGDKIKVATGTDKITIAAELSKLKELRNKAAGEADFAEWESRLQFLEGVERDYPATKKAYQEAYNQLAREDGNLKDYFDSEKSKLETRLGKDGKQKVSGLVNAREATTQKLKKAAKKALKELGRAAPPADRYGQAIKDRTADLNAWKGLTATVTGQQADQKKLRDEIVKARQVGHYGLAYGLLLIAEKKRESHASSGPRLVTPSEVHSEFHRAAERLFFAQRDLTRAQRRLGTDKASLAAATKDLEEHTKNSEATLLADLADIEPPEDAAQQQQQTSPKALDGGAESPAGSPSGDAPSTDSVDRPVSDKAPGSDNASGSDDQAVGSNASGSGRDNPVNDYSDKHV